MKIENMSLLEQGLVEENREEKQQHICSILQKNRRKVKEYIDLEIQREKRLGIHLNEEQRIEERDKKWRERRQIKGRAKLMTVWGSPHSR